MTYQAFAISNFSTGLYSAKEPWAAPSDAFTTLKNAYVYRGILQKRSGYSEFAQMNHVQETITAATQANPCEITTSGAHGLSNGATVVIYSVGGMTELNGNTYTVANASSTTFELSGINSSAYTAYTSGGKVATFQTNGITYVGDWIMSDGTKQMLVADNRRYGYYNATIDKIVEVAESNVFTGEASDFLWVAQYAGKAWLTNGVDRVRTWDGSSDAQPDFDIDGDAANEITKVQMIFPFKRYLCLLSTTEDGTDYPQRIRWSKLGSSTVWDDTISDGGGYVDAPTTDHIVTAQFIKDTLLVFFTNSTWLVRFTGDLDLPFRWERIDSSRQIEGKFGSVNYLNNVWAYGRTGFVSANGTTVSAINVKNPDITLDLNLAQTEKVYMHRNDELRQIWMLHPKDGSSTSDEAFVYNYEEDTWAKFDMPMNVLGSSTSSSSLTWDSEDRAWDDISETWDDFGNQEAYPIMMGGSTGGYIYRLNNTGQDDGSAIEVEIISKRFNPYIEDGSNAKLGWIDFLLTADSSNQLSVDLYLDYATNSYQTTTLAFDSDTNGQKVIKRIHSGAVGASHRFKLSHTASNQTFKIHAIILYFEPSGALNG